MTTLSLESFESATRSGTATFLDAGLSEEKKHVMTLSLVLLASSADRARGRNVETHSPAHCVGRSKLSKPRVQAAQHGTTAHNSHLAEIRSIKYQDISVESFGAAF